MSSAHTEMSINAIQSNQAGVVKSLFSNSVKSSPREPRSFDPNRAATIIIPQMMNTTIWPLELPNFKLMGSSTAISNTQIGMVIAPAHAPDAEKWFQ